MKLLYIALTLILFISTSMAQRPARREPPACTAIEISDANLVTLRCPDIRKTVYLPFDAWGSYTRKEVRLRIDSGAAKRIGNSGDIEPLAKALSAKGREIRIPREVFIRWLNGEVESPDVRTHVFYALTGCAWGRPGEIDPRQCVRIN